MIYTDIITLEPSEQDILNAVAQAKNGKFIDNLRVRTKAVQLDSKIRGYIGEISLRKWFVSQGITFLKSNVMDDVMGIDVDLIYQGKDRKYNLEIKTSLVPEAFYSIQKSLPKADIKLIKRGNKPIEALDGDMHLQIYFNLYARKRDDWLNSQNINIYDTSENLYQKMELFRYLGRTRFVAWIDKPTLTHQINSKTNKTWSHGKRTFWTCNLAKDAKAPKDIVVYLKGL